MSLHLFCSCSPSNQISLEFLICILRTFTGHSSSRNPLPVNAKPPRAPRLMPATEARSEAALAPLAAQTVRSLLAIYDVMIWVGSKNKLVDPVDPLRQLQPFRALHNPYQVELASADRNFTLPHPSNHYLSRRLDQASPLRIPRRRHHPAQRRGRARAVRLSGEDGEGRKRLICLLERRKGVAVWQ